MVGEAFAIVGGGLWRFAAGVFGLRFSSIAGFCELVYILPCLTLPYEHL